MAKRNAVKNGKFEFKGFINLQPHQLDLDAFDLWTKSESVSVNDCIVVLAEAGFKISFSYDDYHGTISGALTCKEPGSAYFGYIFTLQNIDAARILFAFRWLYDEKLKNELFSIDVQNKALDW